jgi:hypothetical protein
MCLTSLQLNRSLLIARKARQLLQHDEKFKLWLETRYPTLPITSSNSNAVDWPVHPSEEHPLTQCTSRTNTDLPA